MTGRSPGDWLQAFCPEPSPAWLARSVSVVGLRHARGPGGPPRTPGGSARLLVRLPSGAGHGAFQSQREDSPQPLHRRAGLRENQRRSPNRRLSIPALQFNESLLRQRAAVETILRRAGLFQAEAIQIEFLLTRAGIATVSLPCRLRDAPRCAGKVPPSAPAIGRRASRRNCATPAPWRRDVLSSAVSATCCATRIQSRDARY